MGCNDLIPSPRLRWSYGLHDKQLKEPLIVEPVSLGPLLGICLDDRPILLAVNNLFLLTIADVRFVVANLLAMVVAISPNCGALHMN